LLFHPAGELHSEHFHEAGGRSFIIEIEPHWLDRVRNYARIYSESSDFSKANLELLVRKLYTEFVGMDDASPLVIEGLMLELVGEASRSHPSKATGRPPRWLVQARELLTERFAERLTLAEVARTVGVHPVHLAQTFRKSYRCTVGDFVRQLRIQYSCQKLATTDMPIVDIALTAGFCDQSHFNRTFKRSVGLPPSQYRDSFR
jgi:AraC family transcriptional regulator